MRTLTGVAALAAVMTTASAADRQVAPQTAAAAAPFTPAPVSAMPTLRRNHCGVINGRVVCADHCGAGYQAYGCPASATGCCHVGLGYCDTTGRLRCGLPWF